METIRLADHFKPSDEGPHREALARVRNLRLNYHSISPGQKLSAHIHHDLDKVFLVERGALRIEVSGTERVLGAGELTLVPAGATHGVVNEGMEPAALLVFVATHGEPEHTHAH